MWPCGDCRCDENGIGQGSWKIPGVIPSTEICARRLVTQESEYFLTLYRHYVRGHLAVAGGLTDQPGIFLDAMEILGRALKHGG